MKVFLIDIPAGDVWQTDIAKFFEDTLNFHRKNIIQKKLFDRFKLIPPKNRTYNLGLLSLATVLKENKYEIEYLIFDSDENLSFIDKLEKNDILCFSAKTTTINKCLKIAKKAKEKHFNILTIFGGPHPTFLPKETASQNEVDIVVIKEGEDALLSILKSNRTKDDLIKIPNIAFFDKNHFIKTKYAPLKRDFNTYFETDYTLLPNPPEEFYLYFETRRGCFNNCSYCATPRMWERKCRSLKAKTAYDRLKKLSNLVPKNTLLHIVNSSFGFSPEDLKLCEMLIEKPINLYFSCDMCAFNVTEKIVKLMYDAGFRMFSIGMESANNYVLKKSNRPTFQIVEKACNIIKNVCDAFIKGYWIVGLPFDTYDTIKETKDKIMHLLKNDLVDLSCEHIFVPYPGCDVFHDPKKYNFIIYHYNWNLYDSRSFPLPAESNSLSMNSTYLAYLDLLKTQAEYYGIDKNILKNPLNIKKLSFLQHKKQLT